MVPAYTYKLTWSTEYGVYFYYGCRCANKTTPDKDLWIVYYSSSKIVKMFRAAFGEPDIIKVCREFQSKKRALDHENKVLLIVDAAHNKMFLNLCNGNGLKNILKTGRKHSIETNLKRNCKNSGKGHHTYTGDYITPWGVFPSARAACADMQINMSTLRRWCRNPDKLVNNLSYSLSAFLKGLPHNPVGKSFRCLGFDFKPADKQE